MSRKKSMLYAPVPQAEIEKKLPMCSMFCEYAADCPHRINLQTESPLVMVSVCMRPGIKEGATA